LHLEVREQRRPNTTVLDSRLRDGGRPPFYIHADSWYSFLLEAESPRPKVRLESSDQMENPVTSSGIEPTVPQPTTLPYTPTVYHLISLYNVKFNE
jgi:hypothetical protein